MDPQLSKMLICSPDYNCSEEIVNIVASMSVPQIFLRPRESAKAADEAKAQFVDVTSDHITLLNAFAAYEEVPITERKQVRERVLSGGSCCFFLLIETMDQKLNLSSSFFAIVVLG